MGKRKSQKGSPVKISSELGARGSMVIILYLIYFLIGRVISKDKTRRHLLKQSYSYKRSGGS
jgi:hypothetical protein